MKALILTCHTGEGHNSTALAIKEGFFARGHTCDIADALGFISPKFSAFMSTWHSRIYRHAPKMFDTGYLYAEAHPSVFVEGTPAYKYLASGTKRLLDLVQAQEYDLIICAHVFSGLMVSELRRRYGAGIPACFVATDYTCSPITGNCNLDLFFIPHEGLADEFVAAGTPRERLVAAGLPVRQVFWESTDKAEARRTLGLADIDRHVLLMCGSMGCGPMEELALEISGRLAPGSLLTILCGTNTKLLHALEEHNRKNLRPLGYTKSVPLLMDSADLFLTKPGGISISEAAAKRLPLLLIDAVGGCEDRNLDYFLSRGWAQTADGTPALAHRCVDLLEDSAARSAMAEAMAEAFSGDAVERIWDSLSRLPLSTGFVRENSPPCNT